MRFDLTDLRLFTAILSHGSITRGAAAMNLALAAASQRVTAMEATLGIALLDRSRRGVRPTTAGALLMRHAQDILFRADQMTDELRVLSKGLRGRLRLPSNTGAVLGFLPSALAGFLVAHPGLDIEIEEHPSVEIVRLVSAGGAEFGIVADFVDAGALHLHRLTDDPLVLVAPAGHHLAERRQIDFTEIMRESFVGLLEAALEQHMAEHAKRRGVTLNHRVRLRGIRAIGEMIQAGIGVAILPRSAAAELAGLELCAIPLSNAWARRSLALCLRGSDELTPTARLLLDHIRDFAAGGSLPNPHAASHPDRRQ
jgi:DNA-binding transcriptional LysR family regulator